MRFGVALFAVSAVLPVPMLAQRGASQVKPTPQALVGTMAANVARITEPVEKDRWQANVELWQITLTKAAPLAAPDLDRMNALLGRIRTSVGKVTESGEKGRWQANISLWEVALAQKGAFAMGDDARLKAPLDRMRANVATITEAGEKERWGANRDLWQGVVDRVTKTP